MKAIVYTEYGSPDVLQYTEYDKPVAGDDEVLVRIHAASLNSADWRTMLVVQPRYIDGYKRCNLMRASSVVKRQLIVASEVLRRFCQAATFSTRVA